MQTTPTSKQQRPTANAPVKAPAPKPAKKVKSGERQETVMHPLLKPNAEGKATAKLDAWPEDYKTTKHKPLSAANFADPATYYNGKADRLQKVVDGLRAQANEAATIGSVKDRGAAKKMLKLQKDLDALKTQLAGEGVDVEAMLTLLKAKQASAAKPADAAAAQPAQGA